jgi:hypothetical protein
MQYDVISTNHKKGRSMKKGAVSFQAEAIKLTLEALHNLENSGYKYVQVKGLTIDQHCDYVEPHYIMLLPMKELPTAQINKDIYEPVDSDLLREWARDINETMQILISISN